MLTIVKEGNKNFQHQDANYADYGANDITIIFDGNTVKLRSFSGRIVFDKDGYNFSNVTIIDNSTSGSPEVYPNITSLKQRLINLGYPFAGGSDEVIVNEVAWGSIIGTITNQGDLITELDAKQDTLVSGTNIKTINGDSVLGAGNLVVSGGCDAETGAGTIIELSNPLGVFANMSTPSNDETLTFNDGTKVLGGKYYRLVNSTNEPTITGATKIDRGGTFVSNTDVYLFAWYNGNRVEYWFEDIDTTQINLAALPFGRIVAETDTPLSEYYGSPSICITDTGRHLYSHDIVDGTNNTTEIYYSDDKGQTIVLAQVLTGMFWGKLFEYNGDQYILGVNIVNGDIAISKSTDNGLTWGASITVINNIASQGFNQAPTNIIFKDGYLLTTFGTRPLPITEFIGTNELVFVYADLTDLTNPSNWDNITPLAFDDAQFPNTIYSNTSANKRPTSVGGTGTQNVTKGYLEFNILERPNGDIIALGRLEQSLNANYAIYMNINWDGITPSSTTINTTQNYIELAGGNIKFDVVYDITSDKYYTIANVNRYKYFSDNRTEAYLLSADDPALEWTVLQKVVGYELTSDWENEIRQFGAQYTSLVISGNDIYFVSRTANADGDNFHNANLLTLSKVPNFRSITPIVYDADASLIIDENSNRLEDVNGIAVIQDQSKVYNSPYLLNADNTSKVTWASGLNFTGTEFLKMPWHVKLTPLNGFTVLAVIENLQSTGGNRLLSLGSNTSDVQAGQWSFSAFGLSVGAGYGAGYTDIVTTNNYIIASSYNNSNRELYNYLNGALRPEPPTIVDAVWSTDHLVINNAWVINHHNELGFGKRLFGSAINFTSLVKAVVIIPSYYTPAQMATLMTDYNSIYSIY